jgi:hypothetical protein
MMSPQLHNYPNRINGNYDNISDTYLRYRVLVLYEAGNRKIQKEGDHTCGGLTLQGHRMLCLFSHKLAGAYYGVRPCNKLTTS